MLTGLKLDLAWLRKRVSDHAVKHDEVARLLAKTERLVDGAIGAVQSIAAELRPIALDSLGLVAAIRHEVQLFAQRTGMVTQLTVASEQSPDDELATALFRIFQELLTNVSRHARASRIQVDFREDSGAWRLTVVDDGVGIPAKRERESSLGLLGMRERAENLGGSFSVMRGEQGGTVAIVTIPQRRDE
jgi:two-component system sensor histidine kinase UhpB